MKAIIFVEKVLLTVLIAVLAALLFPVTLFFSVLHDGWFCCHVAKDCARNLWSGEWR